MNDRSTMRHDLHAGFTDVDRLDTPAPLVTFLDHLEAIPEFVDYKADLRRSLALRSGDVVLDVGCGIGTHTIRIAAGHDGQVVGLDREAMLGPARERAGPTGGVRWLAGDAGAIPLPDASVDACLVERVLMYLSDPAAAIAEIGRVLRPGGRLGAFELDYRATTLVGDPDVVDAAHDLLCRSVAQPPMGRRLPDMLTDAGFVELNTRAVACVVPWPVHEMIVREPVRQAVDDGRLDPDATTAWLRAQDRPGSMTSIAVGVLACARLGDRRSSGEGT